MNDIIVSLATYSKRFDKLHNTIHSIINQTLRYNVLLVNVQDDMTEDSFLKFKELEKLDNRICVRKRPAKWRSFNKFIHAYTEYTDSIIITCDDDIEYSPWMFQKLYDEYLKDSYCIISHEHNPVVFDGHRIENKMMADIKLKQKSFGKYLTGCCLFPPNAFESVRNSLFDFSEYYRITEGTHDELWLWMHSMKIGLMSKALNYTWTFDLDGALPPENTSLRFKNGIADNVRKYDDRINSSSFIDDMVKTIKNSRVVFYVNNENLIAHCFSMSIINSLYSCFNITFDCNSEYMQKSMIAQLARSINSFKWNNGILIKSSIMDDISNGK